MADVVVIAQGVLSALGVGDGATQGAAAGESAKSVICEDAELATAGLRRPLAARVPEASPPAEDRATVLLSCALEQIAEQLDARFPTWRKLRVGLCLGTSSGGMLSAERFFEQLRNPTSCTAELSAEATYFAPFARALSWLGRATGDREIERKTQVVAACASSTIAIGIGMRWIERGACDLVLAGGYDGVSQFVAAGFEKLGATTATSPRPFRENRDGMALGEGVALVAMTSRAASLDVVDDGSGFTLSGFGASCDAVHITAPDRAGGGLRRAAAAALADAALDPLTVDLVSAHGTATTYNDAMEAKAIAAVCPGQPPYVHAFKAQVGHTLGAAGALELLAATRAMREQIAPATCGEGPLAQDASVRVLERAERAPLECVLKLSAAFGGVTASLVAQARGVSRPPGPHAQGRPVRIVRHVTLDEVDRVRVAELSGMARDRIARIDPLGQLSLAVVAELVALCGHAAVEGAGIVAGHALATLETNRRFDERLVTRGPRWVDPRLFPATSPNAGAGHAAIAFQLHGPCFAVCGGLSGAIEAVEAAAELLRAGDVDRMVVVAADDDGPAIRAWLQSNGEGRPYGPGAVAVLLEVAEPDEDHPALPGDLKVDHHQGPIGQRGLREWLSHQMGK